MELKKGGGRGTRLRYVLKVVYRHARHRTSIDIQAVASRALGKIGVERVKSNAEKYRDLFEIQCGK